jgi:hypothetical protein
MYGKVGSRRKVERTHNFPFVLRSRSGVASFLANVSDEMVLVLTVAPSSARKTRWKGTLLRRSSGVFVSNCYLRFFPRYKYLVFHLRALVPVFNALHTSDICDGLEGRACMRLLLSLGCVKCFLETVLTRRAKRGTLKCWRRE